MSDLIKPETHDKRTETHVCDCISRQDAMDDSVSRQKVLRCIKESRENIDWGQSEDGDAFLHYSAALYRTIASKECLPSAEPEQSNDSEFWRKRAEFYSNMCMNLIGEMGKGVKIESVKISENGIEFIKEQPSAQSDPQWIPWNSGKFPEESGTYIVTAYDGVTKRVTYAKYQKRLKQWELTGARAYWRVLAWMPLPEP